MSARVYGHIYGNALLEAHRTDPDPQGLPMTVIRSVDMSGGRAPVEVSFTPPALRALHVAIGIRLVETDRLQTGRPANLVTVHREGDLTSYHDVAADERIAWVDSYVEHRAREWEWTVHDDATRYRSSGAATTRELAEADVAALLRARGYVVEGG